MGVEVKPSQRWIIISVALLSLVALAVGGYRLTTSQQRTATTRHGSGSSEVRSTEGRGHDDAEPTAPDRKIGSRIPLAGSGQQDRFDSATDDDPIAEGWRAIQAGDEEAYEAALIKVPSDGRQAARRALLRGAWAVRQKQLEAALTDLREAASLPELRVRAMVLAGQAFYQARLATNAQQMWLTVLREYPDAIEAHRWLAILYYDLGAMADALQHLARVSQIDPDDPRPDRLMGLINKDFERFDRAIRHYQETLRRDPQQTAATDVRYELAECQLKLRDYSAALQTLAAAPPQARRYALEADAQYSLGETELAEKALQKALMLQPELLTALVLQATWQLEAGQVEQAAETLNQTVKQHPFDYQARFQLAQTLRRLGRTAEAEQESATAAELRQKWERFSELNEQAIREPANSEIRLQLGDLARQIGRSELAVGWYQAALAINPQFELARKRLEALEHRP